jgi:hypothetical protein
MTSRTDAPLLPEDEAILEALVEALRDEVRDLISRGRDGRPELALVVTAGRLRAGHVKPAWISVRDLIVEGKA